MLEFDMTIAYFTLYVNFGQGSRKQDFTSSVMNKGIGFNYSSL